MWCLYIDKYKLVAYDSFPPENHSPYSVNMNCYKNHLFRHRSKYILDLI